MPSKTQRQADAMEHAAHDLIPGDARKIPQHVAQGFNGEDIRAGLWGKSADRVCGKGFTGEDGEERVCGFAGPRPWAAEPPEPPPVEDEDLPPSPPADPAPNDDTEPDLF